MIRTLRYLSVFAALIGRRGSKLGISLQTRKLLRETSNITQPSALFSSLGEFEWKERRKKMRAYSVTHDIYMLYPLQPIDTLTFPTKHTATFHDSTLGKRNSITRFPW